MKNTFNLKQFKSFLDELNIDIKNLDEAIFCIKAAVNSISKVMNIGRFDIELNLPESIFSDKLVSNNISVYKSLNCNLRDIFYQRYNILNIENAFNLIVYPIKGISFSESDRDNLRIICQICYNYYSKIIYSSFIDNASSFDNVTTGCNSSGLYKFGEVLEGLNFLKDYVCAVINLRNFKFINKNLGIVNSNNLLKEFFLFINKFICKDEIISRTGGDNFIAIIKKEHIDDFIASISNNNILFEINGIKESYKLDFRIGLYFIKEGDFFEEVVNKASIALNIAKSLKEDKILSFNDNMLEIWDKETQVLINFENALENDEFEVYYQPKVDSNNFLLIGAEALVRWSKDGQVISPDNFIPILEKEKIIGDLDLYVLETVCEDLKEWIDKGIKPVRVSVNFSKTNLKNPEFANEIFTILDKYEVPGKYIEVEITETSSYNNIEYLNKIIKDLKTRDILVSIDDFGTGYSFLSLIRALDIDVIKLDKSFICVVNEGDFTSQLFVKNIVGLIKDLKIQVIAEGVETLSQLEFLKFIGCDSIQGYLFDKPLIKDVFEKRLINKKYKKEA